MGKALALQVRGSEFRSQHPLNVDGYGKLYHLASYIQIRELWVQIRDPDSIGQGMINQEKQSVLTSGLYIYVHTHLYTWAHAFANTHAFILILHTHI